MENKEGATSHGHGSTDQLEQQVVVVGDWVVDEYNFLVRKHSDVSSHVGRDHFRMAEARADASAPRAMDLCGAGHVAKVLYSIFEQEPPPSFRLFGIGVWNHLDTDVIHHLLHECAACKVQPSISRQVCQERFDGRVHLATLDANGVTNRAVRDYLQEPKGFVLLTRRDFEAFDEPRIIQQSDFLALQPPDQDRVAALVIHDLQKGVVTKATLNYLATMYPEAKWYVRSKNVNFAWPSHLPEKSRRLLLLGPELAAKMNPIGHWESERLTRPAFEILKKYDTSTVVLTEEKQVFARFGEQYITGASTVRLDEVAQVGWSSAVFGALVANLLRQETIDRTRADEVRALRQALKDAEGFVRGRASAVGPKSEPPVVAPGSPIGNPRPWPEEQECWNMADEELGIIGHGQNQRLEVWRALADLPDYLVCILEKRKRIRTLAERLRNFRATKTNLGVMLTADPGAGKTSLARALAKKFDFTMIEVDIAQMIDRTELIDMFDRIVSMQAEGKEVLVFVDEVNATLGNNPVYGTFLAPLQDGVFRRRGLRSILQPCVWIFAGTDFTTGEKLGEKAKDLSTRINHRIELDYASLVKEAGTGDKARLEAQAKREQSYLGALLIRQYQPDVKAISRNVLQWFFNYDPAEPPAREIRRVASALSNVRYGRVSLENCPDDFRQRWGRIESDHSDLIELRF